MNGRRPFRVILAAAAVLLLAGCQLPGDALPPPPVNPNGAGSPAGGGLLHAGRGWNTAGIVGVFPPAGSCHLRFTAAGEPLPDPRCTPGVADQAVTQQNLPDTVCREGGYTRTVRPPRAVTDAAKDKLLAAYGIARSHTREYELDHLFGFGVRRIIGGAEPFPATERPENRHRVGLRPQRQRPTRGVHLPRTVRGKGDPGRGAAGDDLELDHRCTEVGAADDSRRLHRMTATLMAATVVGALLLLILVVWLARKVMHKIIGIAVSVGVATATHAGMQTWIHQLISTATRS